MVVDFNFTTVGLRVTFKNLSDGVPLGTQYQWDFGDGETSFQKNPVHHYKCAGDYSVTLQVIDKDTKEGLGQAEDDILITADGSRFTGEKRIPITIDEVEDIMNR